jgi:hypothetical protein
LAAVALEERPIVSVDADFDLTETAAGWPKTESARVGAREMKANRQIDALEKYRPFTPEAAAHVAETFGLSDRRKRELLKTVSQATQMDASGNWHLFATCDSLSALICVGAIDAGSARVLGH